jgi:uncharacterized protein YjbI with pentapeptide repeats
MLAERAPVRPRVISEQGTTPVLLERLVLDRLSARSRGMLFIHGDPGSGKTTAMRHLAAVLPPDAPVALYDEGDCPRTRFVPVHRPAAPPTGPYRHVRRMKDVLVVCAAKAAPGYRLTDWTLDDRIEYLLAAHRGQCDSIMKRVAAVDTSGLRGRPQLWRVLLDEMAADEAVADFPMALARRMDRLMLGRGARELAAKLAILRSLSGAGRCDGGRDAEWYAKRLREQAPEELLGLLRHAAVAAHLAAERIVEDLCRGGACWYLAQPLEQAALRAAGERAAASGQARVRLEQFAAGDELELHAMAASILAATHTGWTPAWRSDLQLSRAVLPKVCWPEVRLEGAVLDRADLSGANLESAILEKASAREARFAGARLQGASLGRMVAVGADFSHADLSQAAAEGADFSRAVLRGADLSRARLHKARFDFADLREARLIGAECCDIDFSTAQLDAADLTGADLSRAWFMEKDLRGLELTGACLEQAVLCGCNLEGVEWPAARLRGAVMNGALLTGARIPGADLRGAELSNTGLAHVDWEGADLRGANLAGAAFHMGSSRSGLVFSHVPCEGSRTGFYTDEFNEQAFRAPEEIRLANLRAADLREANIEAVDFYLVDLRNALYDAAHEEHLRRCGAILRDLH